MLLFSSVCGTTDKLNTENLINSFFITNTTGNMQLTEGEKLEVDRKLICHLSYTWIKSCGSQIPSAELNGSFLNLWRFQKPLKRPQIFSTHQSVAILFILFHVVYVICISRGKLDWNLAEGWQVVLVEILNTI